MLVIFETFIGLAFILIVLVIGGLISCLAIGIYRVIEDQIIARRNFRNGYRR